MFVLHEHALALGAFLAGLLVAETEYSHQVMADIVPFRDVFASVFFISVGMLVDLDFVAANALAVLGLAIAIVAVGKRPSGTCGPACRGDPGP